MMVNMLELPWTTSLSLTPPDGSGGLKVVVVMSGLWEVSPCITWCWMMLSWIVIRAVSGWGLQSNKSMLMSDMVEEWTRVLTPSQIWRATLELVLVTSLDSPPASPADCSLWSKDHCRPVARSQSDLWGSHLLQQQTSNLPILQSDPSHRLLGEIYCICSLADRRSSWEVWWPPGRREGPPPHCAASLPTRRAACTPGPGWDRTRPAWLRPPWWRGRPAPPVWCPGTAPPPPRARRWCWSSGGWWGRCWTTPASSCYPHHLSAHGQEGWSRRS